MATRGPMAVVRSRRLEALQEGGEVKVIVRKCDGHVLLSVEDNGPGIPEGVDIFQLFVTTKQGGTGLGLSIARQIVAQHGGAISAGATQSGGARFDITLPLPEKEVEA